MSYAGSYRFPSIDQLSDLIMRVTLTRQSTAFNFGHPNIPTNASDELSLEFRWQERVELASSRIFTITQEQLSSNPNILRNRLQVRHKSFLAERTDHPTPPQSGESVVRPRFVLNTNAERDLKKTTSSMYIMADLNRKSRPQNDLDTVLDSSDAGLVVCELHLTEDNDGFQLRVIPDFSNEPYVLRGDSDETYVMLANMKVPNVLQDLQISGSTTTNKRSAFLAKKMLEMSIAQPKEGQIKTTVFGEIVSAVGFPKDKSLFVLYTASSPHGWSLLGERAENELSATFSSLSLPYRSPEVGSVKNIALFGHLFHFNYTTTEKDSLPRMHFKVMHFDVNTERYHTLATGNACVRDSGLICVPLVKTIPKSLIERLRERFIGGKKRLTGIVVGQKIECDSYTVPNGELWIRLQVLRQSRKYRLEDLLLESRLRLLKSSGQTLSTVQGALSAFQEARLKMIQARQEQKQIIDTEVPNRKNHHNSAQRTR